MHVYNKTEHGMKNFKGIEAEILSNVHVKDVKIEN